MASLVFIMSFAPQQYSVIKSLPPLNVEGGEDDRTSTTPASKNMTHGDNNDANNTSHIGQHHLIMEEEGGIKNVSLTSSSTSAATKKSVMIIATVPNNEVKFASLWSQLECLGGTIDKIIISSAKNKFEDELSAFVKEVKEKMPTIGAKIEVQAQWNDRYDAGLWCDALTEGNAGIYKRSDSAPPVVRLSEYDQFFLINDSVMAIEPLNEVLDTLEREKADLISLNYWGDKKGDINGTYWVESPVRAFSKKGIQVYSDKICTLGQISWRIDCPFLMKTHPGWGQKKCTKRCIVDKTEVSVAKYFPQDKVFGLYNGNAGNGKPWANNFKYWKMLRDKQSFPFIKNTNRKLFENALREQPQDLARCTTKYKMAQQNEADPHKEQS